MAVNAEQLIDAYLEATGGVDRASSGSIYWEKDKPPPDKERPYYKVKSKKELEYLAWGLGSI